MRPKLGVAVLSFLFVAAVVCVELGNPNLRPVHAGEQPSASGYKVLEPIRHGSLTVFPVVASKSYSTGEFLTLDEGLRSGEVVVTEYGNLRGLRRRHLVPAIQSDGAEVNRLVLVNNSKRPLLLLAGEIVTGGKQDRVIGKDRIVPPEKRSGRSQRVLRGTRTLGRDQRAFWNFRVNVRRRSWRRTGRGRRNADGATFGARKGYGR